MERLWASWRLGYVTGAKDQHGCVFCEALRADDAQDLVLFRGDLAYVILNLFPYNNGHVMVVPNRHVAELSRLTEPETGEIMRFTQLSEQVLSDVYQPQGLNVGLNLGKPAGGSIAEHLHVHIVPRWSGDTNFLSVIGDVRVLPEELGATAARLRPAFAKRAARPPWDAVEPAR